MILTELSDRGIYPNYADRARIETHWEPLSNLKLYQLERPSSNLVFDRNIGYLVTASTPSDSPPVAATTHATFHVIKDPYIREGNAHMTHFSQSSSGETQGICAEIVFNRFTRQVHAAVKADTIDSDLSGITSAEAIIAQSYGTDRAAQLSAVRLEVTPTVANKLRQSGIHLSEDKHSYIEAIIVGRNTDPEYYVSSPGASTHHTHKVDVSTLISAGIQLPEISFGTNSVYMRLNELILAIDAEKIEDPVLKITDDRFIFPILAVQSGTDIMPRGKTD